LQRIRIIFSKINLPHLQKLEIDRRNVYPAFNIEIEWCIRPFTNTLTTIDLTHEALELDDLQMLSDLFAQEPQILRTASLAIPCVTPQVVDLLANKFQGLQDLTILFFFIKGDVETLPYILRAEVRTSRALCTNHP
jgi:hypothetical protein